MVGCIFWRGRAAAGAATGTERREADRSHGGRGGGRRRGREKRRREADQSAGRGAGPGGDQQRAGREPPRQDAPGGTPQPRQTPAHKKIVLFSRSEARRIPPAGATAPGRIKQNTFFVRPWRDRGSRRRRERSGGTPDRERQSSSEPAKRGATAAPPHPRLACRFEQLGPVRGSLSNRIRYCLDSIRHNSRKRTAAGPRCRGYRR